MPETDPQIPVIPPRPRNNFSNAISTIPTHQSSPQIPPRPKRPEFSEGPQDEFLGDKIEKRSQSVFLGSSNNFSSVVSDLGHLSFVPAIPQRPSKSTPPVPKRPGSTDGMDISKETSLLDLLSNSTSPGKSLTEEFEPLDKSKETSDLPTTSIAPSSEVVANFSIPIETVIIPTSNENMSNKKKDKFEGISSNSIEPASDPATNSKYPESSNPKGTGEDASSEEIKIPSIPARPILINNIVVPTTPAKPMPNLAHITPESSSSQSAPAEPKINTLKESFTPGVEYTVGKLKMDVNSDIRPSPGDGIVAEIAAKSDSSHISVIPPTDLVTSAESPVEFDAGLSNFEKEYNELIPEEEPKDKFEDKDEEPELPNIETPIAHESSFDKNLINPLIIDTAASSECPRVTDFDVKSASFTKNDQGEICSEEVGPGDSNNDSVDLENLKTSAAPPYNSQSYNADDVDTNELDNASSPSSVATSNANVPKVPMRPTRPDKPLSIPTRPPRPNKPSKIFSPMLSTDDSSTTQSSPAIPNPPTKVNKISALQATLFKDMDNILHRGPPPPSLFKKPIPTPKKIDQTFQTDDQLKYSSETSSERPTEGLSDIRRGRTRGPRGRRLPDNVQTKLSIVVESIWTIYPTELNTKSPQSTPIYKVDGRETLDILRNENLERTFDADQADFKKHCKPQETTDTSTVIDNYEINSADGSGNYSVNETRNHEEKNISEAESEADAIVINLDSSFDTCQHDKNLVAEEHGEESVDSLFDTQNNPAVSVGPFSIVDRVKKPTEIKSYSVETQKDDLELEIDETSKHDNELGQTYSVPIEEYADLDDITRKKTSNSEDEIASVVNGFNSSEVANKEPADH